MGPISAISPPAPEIADRERGLALLAAVTLRRRAATGVVRATGLAARKRRYDPDDVFASAIPALG